MVSPLRTVFSDKFKSMENPTDNQTFTLKRGPKFPYESPWGKIMKVWLALCPAAMQHRKLEELFAKAVSSWGYLRFSMAERS